MKYFLANICTPKWNLQQDAGRTFAEAYAARKLEQRDQEVPIYALSNWSAETFPFAQRRDEVPVGDPRIQLSAFQNVSPGICRIHGPSWTQLSCEAVGNPAVRNGTTLGSANMNRLAHAEERRTELKNNTTCLSPAPIQWFTTTWL